MQTDKEHAGYALGMLSTANVAGSLIGPTLGGFIEDTITVYGYMEMYIKN